MLDTPRNCIPVLIIYCYLCLGLGVLSGDLGLGASVSTNIYQLPYQQRLLLIN